MSMYSQFLWKNTFTSRITQLLRVISERSINYLQMNYKKNYKCLNYRRKLRIKKKRYSYKDNLNISKQQMSFWNLRLKKSRLKWPRKARTSTITCNNAKRKIYWLQNRVKHTKSTFRCSKTTRVKGNNNINNKCCYHRCLRVIRCW